jgi:hypothetical protein
VKIASASLLECLGVGSVVIAERPDGERVAYSHVAPDVWLSKAGVIDAEELAKLAPESTLPPREGWYVAAMERHAASVGKCR